MNFKMLARNTCLRASDTENSMSVRGAVRGPRRPSSRAWERVVCRFRSWASPDGSLETVLSHLPVWVLPGSQSRSESTDKLSGAGGGSRDQSTLPVLEERG